MRLDYSFCNRESKPGAELGRGFRLLVSIEDMLELSRRDSRTRVVVGDPHLIGLRPGGSPDLRALWSELYRVAREIGKDLQHSFPVRRNCDRAWRRVTHSRQ